ncbi:MAG: iron-containing alcohol dehydrogenase [Bacteroidales bacterium]|nr:iron-containing alcohol dehydrogenase [Bacteroidales bacterium]
MKQFVFQSTPKLILGENAIKNLFDEVKKLQAKRPFFVCDPVIKNFDIWQDIVNNSREESISLMIFDEICPDPGYEVADLASRNAILSKCDIIIGIGGGSAMDIAKIVAVNVLSGGNCKDLISAQEKINNRLPLILIPTTAGTGSEVTHISILSDNLEQTKNGIVNPSLYADVAILDPVLTLNLPPDVTAYSGVDAIIHAIEALTSVMSNPLSDMLALEALSILHSNIIEAFNNGHNLEARSNMLYGSMLAGKAFANSSVGAIHAFAYPIGAEYHIPHGLANSIMMSSVLRFNLSANPKKYAQAAKAIGIDTRGKTDDQAAHLLLIELDNIIDKLNIKRFLRFYGVTQADISRLAQKVMKITRLLNNNPRQISLQQAELLYMEAL